jgi:hypothetical protein
MNLGMALNKAAIKYKFNPKTGKDKHSKNPWWFVDEVILGEGDDRK